MRLLVLAAAVGLAIPAAALAAAPSVERGHEVYDRWCAPCHAAGPGHPGTQALQAKYKGSKPAPIDQRTDLTAELTRFYVRTGVSIMPFFRKTEISDSDLAALGAYIARPRP